MLAFAVQRGGSPVAMWRLFYLLKIKPGLVFRGLARYAPGKILRARFKVAPGKNWTVNFRDNGLDIAAYREFFHRSRLVNLEQLDPRPQVIYDLGANIGAASMFFAVACPEARIFGFEPVPSNHEVCALNYANLKGAQLFDCAVGSASGAMEFEFASGDLRGGRLVAGGTGDAKCENKIKVAVWSVADLVAIKGLAPPDFLKVDVEGAEFEVLKGLGPCVKTIKQIHLETHSPELSDQCGDWLVAQGFAIEKEHHYSEGLGAIWATRAVTDEPR